MPICDSLSARPLPALSGQARCVRPGAVGRAPRRAPNRGVGGPVFTRQGCLMLQNEYSYCDHPESLARPARGRGAPTGASAPREAAQCSLRRSRRRRRAGPNRTTAARRKYRVAAAARASQCRRDVADVASTSETPPARPRRTAAPRRIVDRVDDARRSARAMPTRRCSKER